MMRDVALVPPRNGILFLCLLPTLLFGPIEECLGCSFFDLCCKDEDIQIPQESLKKNAVSYFTTGGVVADTYFELNDKKINFSDNRDVAKYTTSECHEVTSCPKSMWHM